MPHAVTGEGELRIALTMNGGVSLAVWMGGLASELLQLVRSTPTLSPSTATSGRYDGLLGLIAKQARIDVISGASAGGINGSILALALARDVPSLASLRDLWLGAGDIGKLLRPATAREAPSLLSGDYFLGALERGYAAIEKDARRPAVAAGEECDDGGDDFEGMIDRCRQGQPEQVELDLTLLVTGSVLSGVTDSFPDDIGHQVRDTDHRAVFRFTRRDLEAQGAAGRLARVSRASASFPAAFEPIWIALDDQSSGPNLRPYLLQVENQTGRGLWMVDGGTLVNKPVGLALDAVFAQAASTPVQRMLAYVIPDPGTTDTGDSEPGTIADDENEPVSLASVVVKALVGMPRNESIAAELRELRSHNTEVGRLASLREFAAAELGPDLVVIARRLEPVHRRERARESVAGTMARLTQALGLAGHLEARRDDLPKLEAYLLEEREKHVPDDYLPDGPVSTHGEGSPHDPYWGYGRRTSARLASTVIDLIQAILSALPTKAFETGSGLRHHLDELGNAQLRVHCLSHVIERAGSGVTAAYRDHNERLFEPDCDLQAWAAAYYDDWGGDPETKRKRFAAMGLAVLGCAEELRSILGPVDAVARWVDDPANHTMPHDARDSLQKAVLAIHGLADMPPAPTGDEVDHDLPPAEWTLRQLLAVDLLYSVAGGHRRTPQRVELAQMSAFASDYVSSNPRRGPEAKLTGVSLHHFGAFYKRSWRANDWMWGRLDGISRLIDMTLRPDLLRRVWFNRSAELKQAVEAVATTSAHAEITVKLQAEWEECRAQLEAEMEAVCGDRQAQDGGAARHEEKTTLPHVRRAVARRLQLEVLYEELPVVAFAEARDRSDDDVPTAAAEHFMARVANAFGYRFDPSEPVPEPTPAGVSTPSVDEVVDCFDACTFAEDRFAREPGDDRFTALAGQTAAVATTAIRGATMRNSVKKVLTAVRGVGVFLYFLTNLVTTKLAESRVAQLGFLAAFAAGGAVLALVFLSDAGVGLLGSAVGLALVAVPVFVAMWRRGGWPVGLTVLSAVLLALLVWNLEAVLDRLDWATPEPGAEAADGLDEGAVEPERGGVWGFLIDRKEVLAIGVLVGMFVVLGLWSSDRVARDAVAPSTPQPQWFDRLAGWWRLAIFALLIAALVHESMVDLVRGPVGLELAGSVEAADEYFTDACQEKLDDLGLDSSAGCGPDGPAAGPVLARERDELGQHLWIDTVLFVPAYVLAGSLTALRLRRWYATHRSHRRVGTFLALLILLAGLLDLVENVALWGYLGDWFDWNGWPLTAAIAAYPKWVGVAVFVVGLVVYALGAWSRRVLGARQESQRSAMPASARLPR